jgi:hypothetical protein
MDCSGRAERRRSFGIDHMFVSTMKVPRKSGVAGLGGLMTRREF